MPNFFFIILPYSFYVLNILRMTYLAIPRKVSHPILWKVGYQAHLE